MKELQLFALNIPYIVKIAKRKPCACAQGFLYVHAKRKAHNAQSVVCHFICMDTLLFQFDNFFCVSGNVSGSQTIFF